MDVKVVILRENLISQVSFDILELSILILILLSGCLCPFSPSMTCIGIFPICKGINNE